MKSFPIVYACIVILMILATLIIRTKIKSDKIAILAQHSSVPWCHHAATDREEPSLDCRQLYLDPEGEIASFREFRLWCKGCQEHYQSARWESLSSGPAVGNRSMEIASQKIQAARELVGETPEVLSAISALQAKKAQGLVLEIRERLNHDIIHNR